MVQFRTVVKIFEKIRLMKKMGMILAIHTLVREARPEENAEKDEMAKKPSVEEEKMERIEEQGKIQRNIRLMVRYADEDR